MNIILGHDTVVQEMEGYCPKVLGILLFLQEKKVTWGFDLSIISWMFFLFLSVEPFGILPLTLVEEIRLITDV